MANKAISELPQALNVNNQDLFVLEQSGIAKKLTAETFITEQGIIDALAEALDGHGGIQSVTLSSVSGRIRTYLITFTDETSTTFQVLDGTSITSIQKTSTAGLVDTYTVFMSDGTTSFFQVRNGQDGSATWDQINSKAPVITDTATGAIANFPDGADDIPVQDLVVNIEPKQSGSGDPAPDNIRPISGWTGCNVTRTGKNLFNWDRQLGTPDPTSGSNTTSPRVMDVAHYYVGLRPDNYYYPSNVAEYSVANGAIKIRGTNNAYGVGFPVAVKASTIYTLHGTASANPHLGVGYYDTSWNYLGTNGGQSETLIFTTPSNCAYAVIILRSTDTTTGTTWTNVQLELGSSATTYEPYQGTTVAVDWTTEAGTVYGGTIDFATGLLTVDRAMITIGDMTWTYNSGQLSMVSESIKTAVGDGANVICSSYKTTTDLRSSPWSQADKVIGINKATSKTTGNFATGAVAIKDTSYTDASAFKSAMSSQTICYELATPQTYQLTPQQLNTFLGTNNIFSDCSSVEVEYRADTKLYIEKLTMPTEDDMVANQAITSGKFFMVGNNLYLATAAIANGAQIIEGTNATRLSLADALNALNA